MLPVQRVPVTTVDMPEGPRVFCSTVALARDDIADSRRFEALMEVLAINLTQIAPRAPRYLWFAALGAEAFVSMTPGLQRGPSELRRLLGGFDARILASSGDYLETTARPVMMWSPKEGVIRLWEKDPLTPISEQLRSIAIRNRRYDLGEGFPPKEDKKSPPPQEGVRRAVVIEVPYFPTADGPRAFATGLVFPLTAPAEALERAAIAMLAEARDAGDQDLVLWIWNEDPYKRLQEPGELAESIVLAVTCRGGGIPRVGGAYRKINYFDKVDRLELPAAATPMACVRDGAVLVTFMQGIDRQAKEVGGWATVEPGDAVVDWDLRLPLVFRVRDLTLKNFRSFSEERTFAFPTQTTLIIGDNGKGKSAILDGIAVGLSTVLNGLEAGSMEEVREPWLHREWSGDPPVETVHEPASAHIQLALNARRTVREGGSATRKGPLGRGVFSATWSLNLMRAVRQKREVDLPVVAYYRARRHDGDVSGRPRKPKRERARVAPYDSWNRVQIDPARAQTWYGSLWLDDLGHVAHKKPRTFLPALNAVDSALRTCIDGCKGATWSQARGALLLHLDDGVHAYGELSDGYRLMTALVLDLVWRCFTHNPHLGERAPELSPGVVLIDEVDLHMHPTWQRRVVLALAGTFKGIQFVLTSHSPFIVQSMHRESVIILDDGQPMDYWREGIEDIAVDAMGADEGPVPRSMIYRNFEALSERYMALLKELEPTSPRVDLIRRELDLLQEEMNSNPAVAAVLRSQRLAREAKR